MIAVPPRKMNLGGTKDTELDVRACVLGLESAFMQHNLHYVV